MKKKILPAITLLTAGIFLSACGSVKNEVSAAKQASSIPAATASATPLTTAAATVTAAPARKTASKPKNQEVSITISAAGDCTLGSDSKSPASVNFYAKYKEKKNPAYFFKKVLPVFKKDDMTLVNFEGTLTTSTTRAQKKYTFKGAPSYVNILKKGSIEAVALANNHIYDYGTKSYTDTKKYLSNAGIKYSSFGKTAVYRAKGKKIGMISVCGLFGEAPSRQYIANGMNQLKKKKCHLYIVSIHAGIEHTSVLNQMQKSLAHYAIDKGASLVLGHHPHVLQGVEKYKGRYIAYSLGNFCFGGNTNPSDKDTMIFQQTFTFKKNKLTKKNPVKIIPCCISSTKVRNNYQPTISKGKEKARIIKKMNRYSKSLGVTFRADGTAR